MRILISDLRVSNPSFLPSLSRAFVAPLFAVLIGLGATMASAATTSVTVGIDTDNNPATGCTLTMGGSSMPGVEVALEISVTTTASAGTVGAVTRRSCTAGAFGAPVTVSSGGWPVGMTTGLSGSDLIEAFIPLVDLGGAATVTIGALTASDSMIASRAQVLQETPVQVPALSLSSLLILLTLLGTTGWLMLCGARNGGGAVLMLCLLAGALFTVSALAIVI
ncbi:MAG TPA: hypothetical protein VF371_11630, partial [Candidatus Limnocylindrales bacterium]